MPNEENALGKRLRRKRLEQGLSRAELADAAGLHQATIGSYEQGPRMPTPPRLAAIAHGMGVPVAQLLTDELVLAEVRLSAETIAKVKKEGQPAARAAAEVIANRLEALILAEATRVPVDVSPGARPKRRRSRAEVLAGIAEATEMRAAKRAQRQAQSRIS